MSDWEYASSAPTGYVCLPLTHGEKVFVNIDQISYIEEHSKGYCTIGLHNTKVFDCKCDPQGLVDVLTGKVKG